MMTGPTTTDPAIRFARHYEVAPSGCWEWTGGLFKGSGYGKFNAGSVGGTAYAHRFAFQLRFGAIPAGQQVLHRCDNRRCVNPSHLFLGTHRDNMLDMHSKARGRHCGKPSLTREDVEAIRSAKLTGAYGEVTRLAKKYRISTTHLRSIRKGEAWQIFNKETVNA